ncbi:MAG: eL32 family ribosomal protein, partial [Sulfolobaceae archaeon]
KLKGYPPVVDPGYRKPRFVRYLHPSGLKPVLISSSSDLEKIKDKKDEVIVYISGNIGLRKRLEILNKANELGIKIANG